MTRRLTREGTEAVFGLMLAGLEPGTAKNYGAGLLRFTQFCDELGVPDEGKVVLIGKGLDGTVRRSLEGVVRRYKA